jgi:glycosyltransferase involved in cell wall biosynthesis
MKVAEINTVGGVGSTGKIALSIAHALIEDGNEATVICGREKNADPIISRFQSKTEQYLHVGLTRLASFDTDSNLADTLHRSNAGICVEPGSAEQLANAILREFNNPIIGRNGRAYVEAYADKKVRCTICFSA